MGQAPDRSIEAKAIANMFSKKDERGERVEWTEDERRRVASIIANELNVKDRGEWGLLIKNDRNPPYIPSDTLVWRETREHFDVLTDYEGIWIPVGVLNNEQWQWQQAPFINVGPGPIIPPEPGPEPGQVPDIMVELLRRLDELHADNLDMIKSNHDLLEAINNLEVEPSGISIIDIRLAIQLALQGYKLEGNTKAFGGQLILTFKKV